MSLIVVNPTHRKPKARKKAAPKEKNPMAKKRRSAAQKAAFSRMLAGRKRHHNPAPKRRRRVTRNPHHSRKVYTRRRNPSTGSGSLMNELLSKDGLMMIAAVVGTPTLTKLVVEYLAPAGTTGVMKSIYRGVAGAALGYGVYRFVSKKAGVIVALVSIGATIADQVNEYMNPGTLKGYGTSDIAASGVVKGYLPKAQGNGMGSLRGYSEPGVVTF